MMFRSKTTMEVAYLSQSTFLGFVNDLKNSQSLQCHFLRLVYPTKYICITPNAISIQVWTLYIIQLERGW